MSLFMNLDDNNKFELIYSLLMDKTKNQNTQTVEQQTQTIKNNRNFNFLCKCLFIVYLCFLSGYLYCLTQIATK